MKTNFLVFSLTLITLISSLNPCGAKTSFLKNEHNIPEMNKKFKNPNLDVNKFIKRFEADDREVFIARKKIVEKLAIKKGSVIADIGAGTGIFTLLFSKATGPNGWLYCVDISPKFVSHIRSLADKHKLKNVSCVLNSGNSICLPPNCTDLVFICNTYHHFEKPALVMESVYKTLKPGGRLVLIDFDKKPNSREWIKKHIEKSSSETIEALKKQSFNLVKSIKLKKLKENYILVFEKADQKKKKKN